MARQIPNPTTNPMVGQSDNPMGQPQKGRLARRLILIGLFVGIILGFVLLTQLIIKLNTKPEEKTRSFNTLAVTADYAYRDNVELSVDTQGEVRSQTEINLVPEVGGKIVYVSPNFIEGGTFTKGETLLKIDPADYEVAVIRAESSVAQAEQALVQEIAEGEIALRDFEELGQGEPSALALRKPQRQRAEAALQAAKAELEAANLQLRRTSVKAPFNGRVRSKTSDIGQFVSPGFGLGRIFSTDVFEVRLALTDSALGKVNLPIAFNAKSIAEAPEVKLTAIVGGTPQSWTGKIMRTDGTYNTQTRTLTAIAEIRDPYGAGVSDKGMPLAPGLFVQAKMKGKSFDDMIIIPRDGLRPGNEVYVVDENGVAEIRSVTVIDASPERAVLSSGVDAGELIVLSPMEKSRVSMPLKAIDFNDPSKLLVDPTMEQWAKAKGIEIGPTSGGSSEESKSDDESTASAEKE